MEDRVAPRLFPSFLEVFGGSSKQIGVPEPTSDKSLESRGRRCPRRERLTKETIWDALDYACLYDDYQSGAGRGRAKTDALLHDDDSTSQLAYYSSATGCYLNVDWLEG